MTDTPAPIRTQITRTEGEPATITVGGVEIPPADVHRVEMVIDTTENRATTLIEVASDCAVDFPTEVTVVRGGGSFLDDVTADEIRAVLSQGGYATDPAQLVLAHLRARAGIVPQ